MLSKLVQALTYWPIYLTLRFFVDFKTEGQENLNGLEKQGIIFASNHTSYIDGPICAAAMPRRNYFYPKDFFPIRFTVAKEFFSWKNSFPFPLSLLAALYVRVNGSIPVEKTGGRLFKSLKWAIRALRKDSKVWIYPEGRISRSKVLGQGKRGVAYLHQKTNLPIIPVAIIWSSFVSFWGFVSGRCRLKVRISKPIYSLGNMPPEKGVKIVMGRISKLFPEKKNF